MAQSWPWGSKVAVKRNSWVGMAQNGQDLLDHETLNPGVSHK